MSGQAFRGNLLMSQHVIEMSVVETLVDIAFEWRQIVIVAHEAVIVQFLRRKLHFDDVIMPVQARTLVIGGNEVS
ncbi:hypothetical protein AJ88_46410 [Mesorhizobium amorphae CCBAU 01583]|nr:hypothetical protein AJ88_46410 [Mesorhizobium amorphae CCBAU 01583]